MSSRSAESSDDISNELLQAYAYLSAVAEPPQRHLANCVEKYGVVETVKMVRQQRFPTEFSGLVAATSARHRSISGEKMLEVSANCGARLVTPEHSDWPAWNFLGLTQVAETGGRAKQSNRSGAPLALWVRGTDAVSELANRNVAIVGSRAATSYGIDIASELAAGLCNSGFSVTSGAAFGIDAAAHRGALNYGGSTIAVLACSVDQVYPSAHGTLLKQIAETGLIVSEYAPGTTVAKHRFLTRNRIVAALSQATIVVEAGRRSGAANTAAWARMIGNPVGAFPGSVNSALSVGAHHLIREEGATLVTNVATVIELAGEMGELAPEAIRGRTVIDSLEPQELQVYDAFPTTGEIDVETLSVSAGLAFRVVLTALAKLESHNLVEPHRAAWRRISG